VGLALFYAPQFPSHFRQQGIDRAFPKETHVAGITQKGDSYYFYCNPFSCGGALVGGGQQRRGGNLPVA
jgi:hypothetical protein